MNVRPCGKIHLTKYSAGAVLIAPSGVAFSPQEAEMRAKSIRVCSCCKQSLPITEYDPYYRANGQRTGYRSFCRTCAPLVVPRLYPPDPPQTEPGVVAVQLTRGKWAFVDAVDHDLVSGFLWNAHRDSHTFYANAIPVIDGVRQPQIQMHRLITSAPAGVLVDHVDGDGLNNRRQNIRWATPLQNSANAKKPKNNTSGFKGVTHCRSGKFQAQISHAGRGIYIGLFSSAEEAAQAYDERARELFGEFARLNFPTGKEQAS